MSQGPKSSRAARKYSDSARTYTMMARVPIAFVMVLSVLFYLTMSSSQSEWWHAEYLLAFGLIWLLAVYLILAPAWMATGKIVEAISHKKAIMWVLLGGALPSGLALSITLSMPSDLDSIEASIVNAAWFVVLATVSPLVWLSFVRARLDLDVAEERLIACPCCGFITRDVNDEETFSTCPVCCWEEDADQEDDQEQAWGANPVALVKAQKNFREFGACDKSLKDQVRDPLPDEFPDRKRL